LYFDSMLVISASWWSNLRVVNVTWGLLTQLLQD
jgi:hypothetical protein